jgi:hypothetical protein
MIGFPGFATSQSVKWRSANCQRAKHQISHNGPPFMGAHTHEAEKEISGSLKESDNGRNPNGTKFQIKEIYE